MLWSSRTFEFVAYKQAGVFFGLTYRRVSRYGDTPLDWSLHHVGPITKTAKDAAIILTVIAREKDATFSSVPVSEYAKMLSEEQGQYGVRVGNISEYRALQKNVVRSFKNALQVFEKAGASVDEISTSLRYILCIFRRWCSPGVVGLYFGGLLDPQHVRSGSTTMS